MAPRRAVHVPSAEAALAALPEALRARVLRLIAAADARALALYMVGGPVRDLALGRSLRDADLCVATPGGAAIGVEAGALAREAALAGDRVVAHPRFGTVRIALASGAALDLATVRRERYAAPGALPDVEPGTLTEDLCRRDFTLNALALPLSAAASSSLVDPGGGFADLAAGTLRVFHAGSFCDDPTRALRAARFAARFGFALARESRAALRSALRSGAFDAVSGERWVAELEKLFAEREAGGDAARALAWLAEWRVLRALAPGLTLPRAAQTALRRLDASAPSEWGPGAGRTPDRARTRLIALMVWFAALRASVVRGALERLALRGSAASRIAAFRGTRDAALRALGAARGRSAIDAALRALPWEELAALRAWAGASERRRIDRHAREDRALVLPVTGDDLVAAGLVGAEVGRALLRIRSAVLDRRIATRDDALELARELAADARRAGGTSGREPPPLRRKP